MKIYVNKKTWKLFTSDLFIIAKNQKQCKRPSTKEWIKNYGIFLQDTTQLYNEMNYWSCFTLVTQSCPTFCNPMDCSTPSLPVHQQLLESTQTHVHWVSDAMQPSHPLSSPSLPALNLSQHQGIFKWVSSLQQVAKVLEFQLQPPVLPMNTQDWSPLG